MEFLYRFGKFARVCEFCGMDHPKVMYMARGGSKKWKGCHHSLGASS